LRICSRMVQSTVLLATNHGAGNANVDSLSLAMVDIDCYNADGH